MTDGTPCPACGHPLGSSDQFCTFCGTPVAGADAEVAPGAGPAAPVPGPTPWDVILVKLREATQGRFEIERELGQGGMAAVYLARDVALARKVAIKVMSPAVLMEPGMVDRFKQEAVTIAALKHPHVVTVHGVEHHDLLHFFVLDFVEGGSLDRVLDQYGPLPIPAVRAWLAQVASALAYAHRRGVVHRDIKPANILLDADGNAIVTDFGIAKVAEQRGLTMTGATVGTPWYMSPEQCLAKPVGGASDQYSLGVVAYEMLVGRPPFEGATLEVMRAHTDREPEPLARARPDCPPELAHAVARMLEKEPARRWPSLGDALAAYGGAPPGLNDRVWEQLRALVRGDPTVGPVGSPATPTPPMVAPSPITKRRVPRRAATLGLGAVAVVAALGVALLTWGPGPEPASPAAGMRVASLALEPPVGPLAAGDTLRLSAVARDSGGGAIADPVLTWTSSDETVAAVEGGLLVARAPGAAVITVEAGDRTATARIDVGAGAASPTPGAPAATRTLASVRITPASVALAPGESRSLSATALDAAGRPLPGRRADWSVADPGVAGVSGDGRITAQGVGTTDVIATIEGRRASARITVTAEAVTGVTIAPTTLDLQAGQTAALTALVRGASGTRLTDRAVEWRSTDPAVASVSGDGVVTAVGPGAAIVTAVAGGQVGQAAVTVRAAAAATAIDEAEATRQISRWIDGFVTQLDAALRTQDLAGIRRAYQAPMGTGDVTEWQRRLALDARWRARLARTFPPRRVGTNWVSDFELEIEVQASGRTTKGDQRFLAVFEPGGAGLQPASVEMRLSVQN